MVIFTKVPYEQLNSRQKENYNFQKIASRLAEYGYNSIRLSDDWNGADFLSVHTEGTNLLKIQLKGRLTINQIYREKDIWIAFRGKNKQHGEIYLYPHDEVMNLILKMNVINNSKSWSESGAYDWPGLSKWAVEMLKPYSI